MLIGVNRPQSYNRFDPDAFFGLAKAYYDFDNDPCLRAAVFFGHGENFSRGIDVDAFAPLAKTGEPFAVKDGMLDPFARTQKLSKPLNAVVHGDTWNMDHELPLVADIRVASADVRSGQDENTHGRFPGGGDYQPGRDRGSVANATGHGGGGGVPDGRDPDESKRRRSPNSMSNLAGSSTPRTSSRATAASTTTAVPYSAAGPSGLKDAPRSASLAGVHCRGPGRGRHAGTRAADRPLVARPFSWIFTRTDFNDLLHRIDARDKTSPTPWQPDPSPGELIGEAI